ncbi:hypothetical protein ACFYKT_00130 [Cytobacillus sp. FJAT-53684]|uniref:HEAT repeat domain-containing protein n=1 Tax=Cytobacillus mangrovibacter TaxID=3299024 RepID=A0ABW6JW48_9BACI
MRYVITFFISLLCFLTLYFFQIDNIFIIGLVIILILAAVMFPMLKALFWETNIEKIERFLLKNKKNPNFYIVYAMANENDEDVKNLTEKLLQKYPQKSRQALLKTGEALYFKNITAAKSEVDHIKPLSHRLYYQAIILIEDGDMEGADEVIEKITTKWMENALLAEREKKLNNLSNAKKYAKKAKQHSKGVQRYLLHKTYEREFDL